LAHRLIRWLTFSVTFAFIPFGISLLFRALERKLTVEAVAASPEILFFAIMVSATALKDSREVTEVTEGGVLLLKALESTLFFGAVFSSILYGALRYNTIVEPGSDTFRISLLQVSVWLALFLFVCGTIVEILISQIGEKR
jgi:uncharacterized membrane protein